MEPASTLTVYRFMPSLGRAGLGAVSLFAANAGLALVYFRFDLSLYEVVLVYWWECVSIGLFSALKLIVASLIGDPYRNRYVGMSPGSRVLLSILLIGFVSSTFGSVLGFTGMSLLWAGEALSDAGQSIRALDRISLIIGSSLLLLIGHGVSFVIHFLALGEFRRARVGTLLLLPFKRCLALFVCMAVTIAVVLKWPSLASATGFAAVVIALKVAWDYWLHLGERHTFAEPALEEAAG